jgi:serine/threonine protein kinase
MQAERRGLVGTPAYMAPEQARGEMCGPAVDIYGVAALALEVLTGRPPYDSETPQGALTAVLSEPPALPGTRGIALPGLDSVFEKGLHSDPEQRYATATDFVEALEAVFNAAALRRTAAVPALSEFDLSDLRALNASSARADTVRSRGSSQRHGSYSFARSAARGMLACACAALAGCLRLN